MKKAKEEREALFVRIKKENKKFLFQEVEKRKKTDTDYTGREMIDDLIAGYRKMQKSEKSITAKYFEV